MKKNFLFLCVFIYTVSCSNLSSEDNNKIGKYKRIGLMGAMSVEVQGILDKLDNPKKTKIASLTFYEGRLEGKDIILVESGVGKVLSAMTATILIEKFHVDSIVFTGVAGGINDDLGPLDIIISTSLAQHDFKGGDSDWGYITDFDQIWFPATKELINIAYDSATSLKNNFTTSIDGKPIDQLDIIKGTITTGDIFVNSSTTVNEIKNKLNSDLDGVEMEGASVAVIATAYQIPFVIIRTISDKADGSARTDYNKFKTVAAQNGNLITLEMLKNM